MTRIVTTLGLALVLVSGGTALAQEPEVEALRAFCVQLEAVESPAVVDCFQALSDAEVAGSPEDVRAVVEGFYGTEDPYGFHARIVRDAEGAPTPFDEAD